MNNPVTLPREVVEQVRDALAYVGAGNSSTNPNLAQSTCRQAIWKLDHALRAALEQPQENRELLTEEAIQKLIVPGDYLTLGGLVKFARSVEQAVSGHTGPQQSGVRFAEPELALKGMQEQHEMLLQALKKISAIENQEWGADWEEIDEARAIADAAIEKVEGVVN